LEEQVAGKSNILLEASAEAIKKVIDFVEATADFTIEQAPDLARQFLEYEAWRHGTLMGVFAIPVTLCFLCGAYYLIRHVIKEDDTRYMPGVIIPWIFMCLFGIGIVAHWISLNQVKMAPKVYLLKQIVSIVQSPHKCHK
jgi:hypothetical protein